MNYSYKRYWEPNTAQVLSASLAVNAVASFLSYPFELAKTRIQVRAEGLGVRQTNLAAGYNPFKILREIHQTGVGTSGWFIGFDAHLISRSGYLFIRNILYKTIYDFFKPPKPTNDLTTREKAAIAGFSGAVAAYLTNPFEVIATRIQADGGIYQPHRRGYTGFFDAYNKIMSSSEGSAQLFKGSLAYVLKAIVLNISLTGPYDYLKEKCWITFGDWEPLNTNLALVWASFWATLFTLPFDNIKTRLQKSFSDPSKNRINYSNWLDCVQKVVKYEGPVGLWAGFTAFYLRVYLFSWISVYATDAITTDWKKKAGLRSWEI